MAVPAAVETVSGGEARPGWDRSGVDPESRTGWNVLVQGRASVVEDPDALDQLDRSGLHPWARTAMAHWIQVALEGCRRSLA